MDLRLSVIGVAASLVFVTLACGDNDRMPSSPSGQMATVRLLFAGPTARRTNLPPTAQACVDGVGVTHVHPSWRNFGAFPMQAVPPDRYEISFSDVPVNTRVSFRVNDQNSCDENPTGAVTRNIFVNDVPLVQNTTTPGNGQEPGFAFTIAANGNVTQ